MGLTQLIACCQVSSALSFFSLSKNHAYGVYALWQNACGIENDLDRIFQLVRRIPV